MLRPVALLALFAVAGSGQNVSVHVDASQRRGPLRPLWSYFGYDEANFTYTDNGRKLIRELAELSKTPPQIRTHFLLCTENGRPGLKWGFTNVYTEDVAGKPVYNWTTLDRILGTYIDAGAKPFVEIGFMPEALSSHPDPYGTVWHPGLKNNEYALGWSYPPNNYRKWAELVYQLVKHCVAKYGEAAVAGWNFEVWNEPNIFYWHGTPEEYDTLYDYTADAVKRALTAAHVGGPASTSPRDPKAAAFLRQFLEHCRSGSNAATGKTGAPLDFVSYHIKGQPVVVAGGARMGLSQEMQDVAGGFAVVKSFPQFRTLPIIFSEADPEGCAACSAQVYPRNAYRNGTLYAVYVAAALKSILELAAREQMNVAGVLTWAFEFEDQPYFAGFRSLATHGIDKPVLNIFRMLGLMTGDRIAAQSDAAIAAAEIIQSGVTSKPDIDVLAARSDSGVDVLVWNYRDQESIGSDQPVTMTITGLPAGERRMLVRQFRIDERHSNAFTAWQRMGSPQHPSPEQHAELESAGQLQLFESPLWITARRGTVELQLALPSQAASLFRITW